MPVQGMAIAHLSTQRWRYCRSTKLALELLVEGLQVQRQRIAAQAVDGDRPRIGLELPDILPAPLVPAELVEVRIAGSFGSSRFAPAIREPLVARGGIIAGILLLGRGRPAAGCEHLRRPRRWQLAATAHSPRRPAPPLRRSAASRSQLRRLRKTFSGVSLPPRGASGSGWWMNIGKDAVAPCGGIALYLTAASAGGVNPGKAYRLAKALLDVPGVWRARKTCLFRRRRPIQLVPTLGDPRPGLPPTARRAAALARSKAGDPPPSQRLGQTPRPGSAVPRGWAFFV